MNIKQNLSLKAYNTFQIDVNANAFTQVMSVSALKNILQHPQWSATQKLILGGGSNILFTQNFDGLVIHNAIPGIEKINEDDQHVWLKVGAGVNWHDFVMHCVNNNYAGLENLSLIPGTVGAAPIQNIGAYGVEVKDYLTSVDLLSIDGNTHQILQNKDCQFGYRDSIFKNALKNKAVITHVTFCLNKTPKFHIDYGAIKQTLKQNNVTQLSIKAISDAVIHIRSLKLPDPNIIGNAGSFFKNPIINASDFYSLKKQYADIPYYSLSNSHVKIPAAWLIEQTGWKGEVFGNVAIYPKQPLVLINHNNASGRDVFLLSEKIKKSVLDKFNIMLNTEVNIF